MRITDIQMGFPFIVLAIIILTLVEPTVTSCIVVLSLASWPAYARVLRSNVMLEKEMDYIAAAKAMGASSTRIAIKYLGRNFLPSILPVMPMDIAGAIITESLLSFMSIGIQPPNISLGNIMADGRNYISTSWWITAIPGVVVMIIVLALNLMGDTLQKYFDPKLNK
jgi:peptide/nickel transport system permease protein